ncbi:MAG: type II secretion system protein [Candidatus Methylacidiphilales bacterium]|nr:type II secretion system protein [Candidatus Methylacidiphilales bacterium]
MRYAIHLLYGIRNSSLRGKGRGFSLLEMVLALAILSIAGITLTRCMLSTMHASADARIFSRIRTSLQNHLADARLDVIEPQIKILESDVRGVTFQREIRPFSVRNSKGQQISGLMSVRITATWDSSSGVTTDFAEVYLPATPPGFRKQP